MLIPHPSKLLRGRFLERFDRFIATVELDGRVIEAHCVNPGRMEGMVRSGIPAWVSAVPPESKRKLRYTLEMIELDGTLIGANTVVPNRLVEEILKARLMRGFKRYRSLRREVPYGDNSRIDFLLETAGGEHLIEVKNCHLVYPDGGAYFPDSVSARASGHLEELIREVQCGRRATVLFLLQRGDGQFLRPSALHDPTFARTAAKAAAAGVRFRALKVAPHTEGFEFLGEIPVDLKPYEPQTLAPYRDALAADSGWRRRGRKTGD